VNSLKERKLFLTTSATFFCSDEYLLEINQNHLKHSFYTDVITFCLSDPTAPISGEVYLSTDRIKENAKAYKQRYQTELLRVMIHGALHLCGYKDNTITQKKEMHLKEEFYLKLYFKRFT
jgi:rRNA maturation RNase YbeY